MTTLPDFDNSYASLPDRFFSVQLPDPVVAPAIIRVNHALARQLGFDATWLETAEGAQVAVGNQILEGATPIATVYAGHQFGGWNPQLGDGRAILLGEVLDADGERFDVQLKGSGRTPYSRGGDGRSPLGPVLREYIVSEAMAALGVPTTRSLAAASTGETVRRERELPGAVLMRVARSHIRIGTLEYFAARRDTDALEILVDHVLSRHYPTVDRTEPALALLDAVIGRQSALVAQWQLLGFIHGVMNTDNVLLSGETIDYGPCAFMDEYDEAEVFSSIDHQGRYAYGNQPPIMHWNISSLARALLPVIGDDDAVLQRAQDVLDSFPDRFDSAYRTGMAHKLGLTSTEPQDVELADSLLTLMQSTKSDFTLTFRRLADLVAPDGESAGSVAGLLELPGEFAQWLERWRARLDRDPASPADRYSAMRRANPALIPRNHLIAAAIDDAERGDFAAFHALVDVLENPFDYTEGLEKYAVGPRPDERVCATFCGT